MSKTVKVFLDDLRETPDGWKRTYWPNRTIKLLKTGKVSHLSLDHDLGLEDEFRTDGYTVVEWIEREVVLNGFIPPAVMEVHSANGPGIDRMLAGIKSIKRHAKAFVTED
jgi:hypothetical protein